MRRIFKTVAIMMFCGAMMFPTTLEARGRNNGGNNGGQNTTAKAPNNNQSRPTNNSSNNRNNNNNQTSRPGNMGGMQQSGSNKNNNIKNNNANRNNGIVNNKNNGFVNNHNNGKGNHNNGIATSRPGNMGGMQTIRHDGAVKVGHSERHGVRAYSRPTPPPASYRPYTGWPTFRSILGVALGTTIDLTLNALLNNGYVVNSYGNNMVYLSDVQMLNMLWSDATLYYGTGGGLIGSEFVYCTPGYDVARYNSAYAALIRTYGQPYSVQQLTGNGMRATWWGPSNQYIQLSFQGNAVNGLINYCTTLSFGN